MHATLSRSSLSSLSESYEAYFPLTGKLPYIDSGQGFREVCKLKRISFLPTLELIPMETKLRDLDIVLQDRPSYSRGDNFNLLAA